MRVQGVDTMSFRLECKGNYTRENRLSQLLPNASMTDRVPFLFMYMVISALFNPAF